MQLSYIESYKLSNILNSPVSAEQVIECALQISGTAGLHSVNFAFHVLNELNAEYLLFECDDCSSCRGILDFAENYSLADSADSAFPGSIVLIDEHDETGFVYKVFEDSYDVITWDGIVNLKFTDIFGIIKPEYDCPKNIESLRNDDVHAMYLYDLTDDKVLFEKNRKEKLHPLSITKLLTVILTLERVKDIKNTKLEFDENLLEELRRRKASITKICDYPGYEFSVEDYLYACMVPSGCESAMQLALYLGNGSIDSFLDIADAKLKEIGCLDTKIYDSTGLNTNSYTTAEDVFRLFKYALKLNDFKRIASTSFKVIEPLTDSIMITSWMMNPKYGMARYFPYVCCGKTGSNFILRNYVCLAERAGKQYISVVLNDSGKYYRTYETYQFKFTRSLLEYAFELDGDFVEIGLCKNYIELDVGQTYKIIPRILHNQSGKMPQLLYASNNPDIASVNSNGVILVNGQGIARIKVYTESGDYNYCFVNSTGKEVVTIENIRQ